MLDRIIDALRFAGVDCIAVVGGDEVRNACADRVEKVVDESDRGSENVLRALRAWPNDGTPFLYATSDMPYVNGEAVLDFVGRVPDGALAMAVAEFSDFTARFPDAPPAFGITLAGERIVNGGLLSIPGGSAERIADFAMRLFDARKQPWRMATLVSPLMLIRFALGRLGISQLEATAERLVHVPAKAVRRCAPELGFDADDAPEFEYARTHA
jgi:GTP:adenosylcobinamide-phosphate guanylyltransferase